MGHICAMVGPVGVEPERRRSGGGRGCDADGCSGTASGMNEITRILSAIELGDPRATEDLLPLVYDELRKLAAAKLRHMGPGQTLQPTALVHEAYLRLVKTNGAHDWNSRGHFFGAAAEAMRRILVESYRRKKCQKHGGHMAHRNLDGIDVIADDETEVTAAEPSVNLIALDTALAKLDKSHPTEAKLVKLRYFTGMTNVQAACVLGISPRQADRLWSYAKAWLKLEM
jgi:RNA polymerase sigma factor (TIGR02999 family)